MCEEIVKNICYILCCIVWEISLVDEHLLIFEFIPCSSTIIRRLKAALSRKLPEGKEDALSLSLLSFVRPPSWIPLPTTVTASVAATALAVVGAFSPILLL